MTFITMSEKYDLVVVGAGSCSLSLAENIWKYIHANQFYLVRYEILG